MKCLVIMPFHSRSLLFYVHPSNFGKSVLQPGIEKCLNDVPNPKSVSPPILELRTKPNKLPSTEPLHFSFRPEKGFGTSSGCLIDIFSMTHQVLQVFQGIFKDMLKINDISNQNLGTCLGVVGDISLTENHPSLTCTVVHHISS